MRHLRCLKGWQLQNVKTVIRKWGLLWLLVQLPFSALADTNDTNTYLEHIKHDPNALYAFFKAMPKGGELHYHLLGGAYPEVMLKAASRGQYCLDRDTWQIKKITSPCDGVPSKEILNDANFYEQVLRAWSMKAFNFYGSETGHDHFFATFFKFYLLAEDHYPELLIDTMQRAANQREYYLEIMVMPSVPSVNKLPNDKPLTVSRFTERRKQLLASPVFQSAVTETSNKINADLIAARKMLGCGQNPARKACQLTIKFQYYALRTQSLANVFEQALLGFMVAEKNPNVVAVNLVQPEDALIALRDYKKQMQIFQFLHTIYPKVGIALHAGELNPQSVMPKDTRFHIRDAIYTGHASRIGHGVDIAHEQNPEAIMRYMKQQGIAVEINLVSNATILKVKGKQHPLNYYLKNQVPVVLSTDDEGILRTDLTSQYVLAVLEHGLDYLTIKQINRNALTYSFLSGNSLWKESPSMSRVAQCVDLNSRACHQFVKTNEKARVQRQLEMALSQFEARYPLSCSS